MKKILVVGVVIFTLVFIAGISFAVDLSFGVKGGVNLASYYGDDTDITGVYETKSKFGYCAGLFA